MDHTLYHINNDVQACRVQLTIFLGCQTRTSSLASVNPSVSLEVAGSGRFVPTATPMISKRRLARMRPSVSREGTGFRSSVLTALPVTGKWLLARVSSSVLLEVG